ncbi:hypothetical protein HHUSO_G30489 [Huso huso]|uniref:Secreted protein n=2 Tax=Huso huso TaxID=61971 RepID=A0ABR0YEZ8_HUSHU
MDPGFLIFLLYVMIIHELVCGLMEHQRQATKPKKQPGPVWTSGYRRSAIRGTLRFTRQPTKTERPRDWRKSGRIVRKA